MKAQNAATFPATKSLDSFDFKAIPTLDKALTMELARCEFADRRESIIALGPVRHWSRTHGDAMAHHRQDPYCPRPRTGGLPERPEGALHCRGRIRQCLSDHWRSIGSFHELVEAVDDRRLQRLQKTLASQDLLIIDELGFVPLSKTGAELLFEIISQRYERGSIIITSNLPFDEWTEVFGSERLTGAILDRLTHHVHILEMNGESFRLRQSRKTKA